MKKVKHIFIFFLLFDAISLIITSVLRQKATFLKVFASKSRSIQQKNKNSSGYYTLNRTESIKNSQKQLQMVAIAAVSKNTTATDHIHYLTHDIHQPGPAYRMLPKLMLFPYHSFW